VVYMVAIIWLIATHYSGTQTPVIEEAQFWLVRYPLGIWGLSMFGPREFWNKYELLFFPACFPFSYLLGSAIGWVFGFEKLRKPPNRW
jgi:hypothetical protein